MLVITVPFLGQAFHIDDSVFWDFARANLQHPLTVQLPHYQLEGQLRPGFRDTHPPLDAYYLAVLMAITGRASAAVLHLGFLVFPLMAGASMFFLGRRFTRSPALAAIMLMATPAVMVSIHSLMADAPMMALWLAATAAYVAGVDRYDQRLLSLSGVMAALAVYTGYQAVALIGLLPLYALLKRRLGLRTAWPLGLPAAGFGAYCLINIRVYGSLPPFQHVEGLSEGSDSLLIRLQGTLLDAGGAAVFPLVMAAVFSLRGRRYLALPLVALAAAALAGRGYNDGQYPFLSALLFTAFLTAGGMMLLAVAGETGRQLLRWVRRLRPDTDLLFLAAWLLLLAGMVVFLLPHTPVKYTLPFLPPLVLLFFREMEAALTSAPRRKLAVAALLLTLATGAVASAADYQMAASSRSFVKSFAAANHPPGRVWFIGEWGFRHYMEQRGYGYLSSVNDSPRPGDIVVGTEFSSWPLADSLAGRLRLQRVVNQDWRLPVRVMNYHASAGFYGNYWGDLPYAISGEPVQRFDVYEVAP